TLAIVPGLRQTRQQPGLLMLGRQVELTGIALGLGDAVGDIDALTLGFNDGDGRETGEQYVVGACFGAAGGPLGDGLVLALLRARALAVGEIERVGFPAGVDQLL